MFKLGHTVVHRQSDAMVAAGYPETAPGIVTGVNADGTFSLTLFQPGRLPEPIGCVPADALAFPEAPGA